MSRNAVRVRLEARRRSFSAAAALVPGSRRLTRLWVRRRQRELVADLIVTTAIRRA
jgi:hypothetical protein